MEVFRKSLTSHTMCSEVTLFYNERFCLSVCSPRHVRESEFVEMQVYLRAVPLFATAATTHRYEKEGIVIGGRAFQSLFYPVITVPRNEE